MDEFIVRERISVGYMRPNWSLCPIRLPNFKYTSLVITLLVTRKVKLKNIHSVNITFDIKAMGKKKKPSHYAPFSKNASIA
jgi:hypothetical protein